MTYSSTNPIVLLTDTFGTSPRMWLYRSTHDSSAIAGTFIPSSDYSAWTGANAILSTNSLDSATTTYDAYAASLGVSSTVLDDLRTKWGATTAQVDALDASRVLGFLKGCGDGSHGANGPQMRIGDLLMHIASTDATFPGVVTTYSAIQSTANATAWPASFDITLRYQ